MHHTARPTNTVLTCSACNEHPENGWLGNTHRIGFGRESCGINCSGYEIGKKAKYGEFNFTINKCRCVPSCWQQWGFWEPRSRKTLQRSSLWFLSQMFWAQATRAKLRRCVARFFASGQFIRPAKPTEDHHDKEKSSTAMANIVSKRRGPFLTCAKPDSWA